MRLRMRKEEVTRGQNVATRIRQFETANNNNNNDNDNNISYHTHAIVQLEMPIHSPPYSQVQIYKVN